MNRALFLDRDGVINVDHGYVHKSENFDFVDGIFDVCRVAKEKGYLLIVITNQAGIGRGYYSEREFHEITQWMMQQFSLHSADLTKVYFCPDHPESGLGKYKRQSFFRKPEPGMILAAANEFNIDLSSSVLVGDKISDIAAGRAAGVAQNILLDRNLTFNFEKSVITHLSQLKKWI